MEFGWNGRTKSAVTSCWWLVFPLLVSAAIDLKLTQWISDLVPDSVNTPINQSALNAIALLLLMDTGHGESAIIIKFATGKRDARWRMATRCPFLTRSFCGARVPVRIEPRTYCQASSWISTSIIQSIRTHGVSGASTAFRAHSQPLDKCARQTRLGAKWKNAVIKTHTNTHARTRARTWRVCSNKSAGFCFTVRAMDSVQFRDWRLFRGSRMRARVRARALIDWSVVAVLLRDTSDTYNPPTT